jgi:serine/threonine protein kinase
MSELTNQDAVATPSQEWQTGEVILDLYEVKRLLGEGGMGKVYRVYIIRAGILTWP